MNYVHVSYAAMAAKLLVGLDSANLVQRLTHPSQFYALPASSTPTVSLCTVLGRSLQSIQSYYDSDPAGLYRIVQRHNAV